MLAEARRPTPADHGADAVLHALLQVAGQAARAGGLDLADVGGPGVGVGCGGPMRWPEGVVSPLNLPVWRDFPLRARLADALGRDDVVVHNDVVAFALAEAVHGAGTDATSLLGVAVSTGVGGGMVVDGRPVPGPRGQAGHVGHVVVEPDGPRCGCGGRGCLEAVARGPALAPRAGYADGHALVRAARDGEDAALQALARAGRGLGRALAGAAALLDLDVVVVGGGLGRAAFDLLEPAVHRGLGRGGPAVGPRAAGAAGRARAPPPGRRRPPAHPRGRPTSRPGARLSGAPLEGAPRARASSTVET